MASAETIKSKLDSTNADLSQLTYFDYPGKANVNSIRVCNAPGSDGYISSIQVFAGDGSKSWVIGRATNDC